MIRPNTPVPALSLPLTNGGTFDLSKDSGENGQLLLFYRGLHCPLCIKQMGELQGKLDKFAELGITVTMISSDTEERAIETAAKAEASDVRVAHGLSLTEARDDWGLWISSAREGSEEADLFTEPGTFFVNADGTLNMSFIQNVPFARPTLDDLLSGLNFVLSKGYPVRGKYTGALPS